MKIVAPLKQFEGRRDEWQGVTLMPMKPQQSVQGLRDPYILSKKKNPVLGGVEEGQMIPAAKSSLLYMSPWTPSLVQTGKKDDPWEG